MLTRPSYTNHVQAFYFCSFHDIFRRRIPSNFFSLLSHFQWDLYMYTMNPSNFLTYFEQRELLLGKFFFWKKCWVVDRFCDSDIILHLDKPWNDYHFLVFFFFFRCLMTKPVMSNLQWAVAFFFALLLHERLHCSFHTEDIFLNILLLQWFLFAFSFFSLWKYILCKLVCYKKIDERF